MCVFFFKLNWYKCLLNYIKILDLPLKLPKWPNHTQAVERGIKLVTESCTAVTGAIERDGYIRQRMHSRQLMPKFNTKNEFNHYI